MGLGGRKGATLDESGEFRLCLWDIFTLAPSPAHSAPLSRKFLTDPQTCFSAGWGVWYPSGLRWPWAQTQEPKAKGIGKMAGKLEVHVPLIVLLFILSKYPSE